MNEVYKDENSFTNKEYNDKIKSDKLQTVVSNTISNIRKNRENAQKIIRNVISQKGTTANGINVSAWGSIQNKEQQKTLQNDNSKYSPSYENGKLTALPYKPDTKDKKATSLPYVPNDKSKIEKLPLRYDGREESIKAKDINSTYYDRQIKVLSDAFNSAYNKEDKKLEFYGNKPEETVYVTKVHNSIESDKEPKAVSYKNSNTTRDELEDYGKYVSFVKTTKPKKEKINPNATYTVPKMIYELINAKHNYMDAQKRGDKVEMITQAEIGKYIKAMLTGTSEYLGEDMGWFKDKVDKAIDFDKNNSNAEQSIKNWGEIFNISAYLASDYDAQVDILNSSRGFTYDLIWSDIQKIKLICANSNGEVPNIRLWNNVKWSTFSDDLVYYSNNNGGTFNLEGIDAEYIPDSF